jgi:hypothetical protein
MRTYFMVGLTLALALITTGRVSRWAMTIPITLA